MTVNSISNISVQQTLTTQLQAEEAAINQLDSQLATSQKYTNLTDYSPSDALNLMNLKSSATQSQAYISAMTTVQSRLSGYDTTMTDMESIVSQAQSLASGNPNYSGSTAASLTTMAKNYLQSVELDLNQQIGGQYIYAGARYNTAPVGDLTSLGSPSQTVYTDGSSLPDYDSAAASTDITMSTSGQTVTVGGTTGDDESASITVNGTTYTYPVTSTDTPTSIASGLAALVVADIPGTTSSGATLTVGSSGTINATSSATTDSAAYTLDSATINSGFNVTYGISSDAPAFQQLISGLQYLSSAGSATDQTTYQNDISQANTLLTSALSGIQALHANVAGNINTLTNETATQKSTISSITDQIDNIQQVDLTQVSTEINLLQTQLQASYSATGMIEKMSIVDYL